MQERSLFPLNTCKETKRPQDNTHAHIRTHMNVTSKQPALNLNRDVKLQLLGGKYKNEINTAKTKAAITDAR